MSTQLILYPQSYEGQINSTVTPTFNQFLVNRVYFIGLNTTTLYNTTAGSPSQDAILNSPPALLGNWYRFTTTGSPWGNVTAPAVTSNNLVLSHNATLGHTGVYQQLSGLIVGSIYEVIINISTTAVGVLTVETFTGNVIQHNQSFSSATAQIITTFEAQSTNDIFLIDFSGTASALTISSISITESASTPTLVYSDLEDGQVICDLYQEEDIPLSLSIDDFKNVAEQVKSYSKDFSLPATKRNNQIFNNMFEITRSDDGSIFNPYVKTQCVLKQDGFILFEGYLRMLDIKDKEGEISYNVNLFSEVIALADILKELTFEVLDFDELEHNYNYTEIRNSWQGILTVSPLPINSYANNTGVAGATTTDVLRYPFIDWNHQFTQDATTGFPVLPNLESAFRPCIQLKYLINKIFSAAGFSWTSDFFDTTDFGKLYMDFNWGADNEPVVFDRSGELTRLTDQSLTTSYTTLNFEEFTFFFSEFGYSAGTFTAQENGQVYNINYNMSFRTTLGTETLDVRWLLNGIEIASVFNQPVTPAGFIFTGSFNTGPLIAGDTLLCQAKSSGITMDLKEQVVSSFFGIYNPIITATTSSNQTTNDSLLGTLRGELGQWDFLKGIMTMFNLVSLVDENDPTNILIEPYSDVFINNTNCSTTTSGLTLACRSIQHDWTDKIDVSEMELKPLTDLNKTTIFKFVEDEDDYVFSVYKQSTSGHLYGSKVLDASGFTILEGTEEITAEPFAATVSKPLMSQFSDLIVPSIYALNDDGTSEGFDNLPRIFYNNGVQTLTSCTYNVPCQNQTIPCGDATEDEFLQFSHLTEIPTTSSTTDFVFQSEQLFEPLGLSPVDNLYSTYWQPYFNELYNANTRTMKLKVNLSPSDIANFKFYDVVFIKNRTFRVNKIDYKPNDLATVEFILIP